MQNGKLGRWASAMGWGVGGREDGEGGQVLARAVGTRPRTTGGVACAIAYLYSRQWWTLVPRTRRVLS